MNGYIKRIMILLMCVTLVISAPAAAMAAPAAMPEPSVGAGEDSFINSEDKAESSTSIDILITGTLEILAQTEDCLIKEGDDLELAVEVTGVGPFKYTWEVSTDGGATWQTPDGATDSPTYQIVDAQADAENAVVQQFAYRVTVEDKFGNEESTIINIGVEDNIAYLRIPDEEDKVAVSAWMLKSTKLISDRIGEGNPAYDELYRHLTPGCLPINAVNLALYNDVVEENYFIGQQEVEFLVGDEYNGETLKVFQLLDGEVIEYTGVVVDGVLTIVVDELSQFMVEAPSDEARIITVNTGEGGTASPNGDITVREGDDRRIVFLPDAGYVIDKVLLDGEEVEITGNYLDLEDISEDHTVDVTFKEAEPEQKSYAVRVIANEHGSADPSGYFRVPGGDTLIINVTPDPGYEIDRVRINWDEEYAVVGNQIVFPSVVESMVVEIFFREAVGDPAAVTRVITATADAGGSISPEGETDVAYGGDMYFNIIPDEGYVIDKVYVDGVEVEVTDGTYHFINVVDDRTIHATFKEGDTPDTKYVTVETISGDNGSISPEGEVQVPVGGSLTVHFTPDSGYVVRAVYVDGKLVANGGTSYTIDNITADTTVRVEFSPVALIPTGDITPNVDTTLWWVLLGAASGIAILMIILIIVRRRKKDEEDEEGGQDTEEYPLG